MPATTTQGLALPYPLQTDPVANGAADIEALAKKIDLEVPHGRIAFSAKPSDQGGFGAGALDTGIPAVVVPAGLPAGRFYTVAFNLGIVQTTAPGANAALINSLRAGSAGGTVVESWFDPFVDNTSVNGRYLRGQTSPLALTPGTGYVLTTQTDGIGRYTIKGGVSWLALYDVT